MHSQMLRTSDASQRAMTGSRATTLPAGAPTSIECRTLDANQKKHAIPVNEVAARCSRGLKAMFDKRVTQLGVFRNVFGYFKRILGRQLGNDLAPHVLASQLQHPYCSARRQRLLRRRLRYVSHFENACSIVDFCEAKLGTRFCLKMPRLELVEGRARRRESLCFRFCMFNAA